MSKVHKFKNTTPVGHSFLITYNVKCDAVLFKHLSFRWKDVTCKKCLKLRKKREFNKQK